MKNEIMVKCHGCGRAVVEVTARGAAGDIVATRERPWWCIVMTRRRECEEGKGVTLPNGETLRFNEYPNACSVACVRTVAATWPRLEPVEGWTPSPSTREIEGEIVSISSTPKIVYPEPPAEISDLWQPTEP